MEEESLKKEFAKDMVLLKYVGINPVVVHGVVQKSNNFLNRAEDSFQFRRRP